MTQSEQPRVEIEQYEDFKDIKDKHWKRGLEISDEKGNIVAEMHDLNIQILQASEKMRDHYKRLKVLNAEASKWALDAGVEEGQRFVIVREKPQIKVFGVRQKVSGIWKPDQKSDIIKP